MMKRISKKRKTNIFSNLLVHDFYSIFLLLIYSIFALALNIQISNSFELFLTNMLIIATIIFFTYSIKKYPHDRRIFLIKRLLYAPLVFIVYSQIQNYLRVFNPYDYDSLLIAIDHAICGVNPTQWLSHISFPALTEYLQIAYMTYFLLPLMQAIELHNSKNDDRFNQFASMILFSFYTSYLLYLVLPAIGPRFTLHNFSTTSLELPGLWLTETLRNIVNAGEGIVAGANNPAVLVNRDCMPSGHTMMTLVNILFAFKYKSKFKWLFLILGASIIIATVYLRYHYVIDIIVGAILAILVFNFEPKLRKLLLKLGLKG